MLKLADNPPVRPPDVPNVRSAVGDWWVAHTKARAEKALAWELLALGTPYLLPMISRLTVWKGRNRRSLVPLFPSYVFFCGGREQRQQALATNRVCQVLPVRERDQFVAELSAVETALESGVHLDFYPHAALGRRCRICRGPLRGLEGTVVQAMGVTRLVLQVSILGQGASVETTVDALEAAE